MANHAQPRFDESCWLSFCTCGLACAAGGLLGFADAGFNTLVIATLSSLWPHHAESSYSAKNLVQSIGAVLFLSVRCVWS